MRNIMKSVLTLGAIVVATAAWTKLPLSVSPQSRIWIEGTSTVRSFSCKASSFDAQIEGDPDAVAGILDVRKAIQSVVITVPSAKLDCGNGTMNEHMMKAIKGKENPNIVFRLSSYDVSKQNDAVGATLQGKLSLGGSEHDVAIPVTASGHDGSLEVVGSYELKLSDYGLKAPSLMLGTMRVGDKVKIKFDMFVK